MNEQGRIVVSLSISHIKGRREKLIKKLRNQMGREPSVAELRAYVQNLSYAAIDADIAPQPAIFYVRLAHSRPTGEILSEHAYWSSDEEVRKGGTWLRVEAEDLDDLRHEIRKKESS